MLTLEELGTPLSKEQASVVAEAAWATQLQARKVWEAERLAHNAAEWKAAWLGWYKVMTSEVGLRAATVWESYCLTVPHGEEAARKARLQEGWIERAERTVQHSAGQPS